MDKWDLSVLFKNEEEFEKSLDKIQELGKLAASYKGKLKDDTSLCEYFSCTRELSEILDRTYSYAHMASDLDRKDVKAMERLMRVFNIANEISSETSFESPEIISIGKDKMIAFFKNHPDYSDFDFSILKLFDSSDHVLDDKSEKIISNYAMLERTGSELYGALTYGDGYNNTVELSNGEKIEVTFGNWTALIPEYQNPEDRQKIFEAIYSKYEKNKNTYGGIYSSVINSQLADIKNRSYDSILASHLEPNRIPLEVFKTLIKVVNEHTDVLKRYYEIRRKFFHLEKHRTYDRFLEMAKSEKKYTYQEAKDLFFKSIEKFGGDFENKAHEVLKDGYVDVYESLGKVSGAYSSGGNGIHPFILLNFNSTLDSVFTLAHESGHSIHTLYSLENQPTLKQNYTIFVAEIASTFNEHNLLDYLLNSGELSKNDKISLLQKSIDDICATFFRQALFAQYEYEIASLAEKGEPVNYQTFSNKMIELYEKYYGIDIREEKVKEYVWAYIPHLFNTPFYVYQYATCFAASMQIYANCKSGDKKAMEAYINMLKSGGSEYPYIQVKNAGVDLAKEEPYLSVIKRMEELLDQLEELVK